MSRLALNIVHDTNGQLQFGIQSDNADQQVELLRHQLANAHEKLAEQEFAPLPPDPRVAELEKIIENQRSEICSLNARINEMIDASAAAGLTEAARVAKNAARRKKANRKPASRRKR